MASLEFEGNLVGLNERQKQFIREVIAKQGFTDNKVLFEAVGKAGDNYASQVKRITIVTNGPHDIKIIAKVAPKDEIARNMGVKDMFNNEIIMYEQVLPKLVSLQKIVDVPDSERIKFAKCYGYLSEEPNEMILLEDLAQSGYIMLDRFVPLKEDAVKLTLKHFSILHSLSFVLKHLEPDTFENYTRKLTEVTAVYYENDDYIKFFAQTEANTISVLEDETQKKTVHDVLSQWLNLYREMQRYENPKHCIIQQGDGWTNNIMFRLQDGTALDCIMIDYQMSKASNPVCDLLYMILNCTDHSSRSKHFQEWIDYYHEELDKSLSNYGLKASLIYPRYQLDVDLKKYSKLFFCICVLLYGMSTKTEEEAAIANDAMKSNDLDEVVANMGVSKLSRDTVDLFRSRVSDLIDSFRLFGYVS